VPYEVTQFQTTPNPNALKCVLDRSPAPDRPRSYLNATDAIDDPIAAALFSIPGVTNLLIHDGWITVGKNAAADWKPIKAGVRQALIEAA